MKYPYIVCFNGTYYKAGEEVPCDVDTKTEPKEEVVESNESATESKRGRKKKAEV